MFPSSDLGQVDITNQIKMIKDPIVEEIHKIRHNHAAKFNFDVAAICADYRERERQSKLHIVSRSTQKNLEPEQKMKVASI